MIKLSSSTNFWIVLAFAGDSTITRVIPSFALSQLAAELIIFSFGFVANNLMLVVNEFRKDFMDWLDFKADTLIKRDSRKVIDNIWNVVSERLFVIIPTHMRRSLIFLMLFWNCKNFALSQQRRSKNSSSRVCQHLQHKWPWYHQFEVACPLNYWQK